jgi:hypothetical protein
MLAKVPARFRPVADVAFVTGRPHRTIRTWVARGDVASMKHRGTLLVDLVAADELSKQAGRRNRAAA